MIKILHFATPLSSNGGGVLNYIRIILNNLSPSEFKLFLYYGSYDDDIPKTYFNNNIVIIRDNYLTKNRFSIFPIFRVRQYIKNNNINIVHCHFIKSLIFIKIALVFLKNVKIIYTIHGTTFDENISSILMIYLYIWSVKITNIFRKDITYLSVSKYYAKEFSVKFNVNIDKIKIIHPGIQKNESSVRKIINKENTYNIGIVARLTYEKGVDVLINSFFLVKKEIENCRLHIVGDGFDKNILQTLVNNLNLSGSVIFYGEDYDSEKYLKSWDLLVISSYREGMPLILLEGIGAGIPVIASKVGGIPEIIGGNVDILFEQGDYKQLAIKIISLLRDPKRREFLSNYFLESVSEKYSRHKYLVCIENIYKKNLVPDEKK